MATADSDFDGVIDVDCDKDSERLMLTDAVRLVDSDGEAVAVALTEFEADLLDEGLLVAVTSKVAEGDSNCGWVTLVTVVDGERDRDTEKV